jgi:hypothetical protein
VTPNITRQSLIALLCILVSIYGLGQNKYTLPQKTPQAPNAASFAVYGEVPVSLSNGIANVSIPLLGIKLGSFELPISLSYHNNGLKVDAIPSFVGLGWNLNAGGVINYEQRGNPDFSIEGNGMFSLSPVYSSLDSIKKFISGAMPGPSQRLYNYGEMLLRKDVDGEFDLYHYNFMGISGSFYFDTNQHIISVPKNNMKIQRDGESFIIIDEKGNKYVFAEKEPNQSSPYPDDGFVTRRDFNDNAAYFLTHVLTAEGRNIYFEYTNYPFSYQVGHYYHTHMDHTPGMYEECPSTALSIGYTNFSLHNTMLSAIVFDEGSIQFEMSTTKRADLKTIDNGIDVPYLYRIKLLNSNATVIKDYRLHYNNGNRLQLTDIVCDSLSPNPEEWKFEYYNNGFPAFFSKTKDHWGYYNGVSSVKGIPNADYESLVSLWVNGELTGTTNRESNISYSISGVLKSITYPTGGKSSFEYEANQVTFTDPDDIKSNPFLQRAIPHHFDNIFNDNTTTEATISGSFTLTQPEDIAIIATRYRDEPGLIYSVASLSTTLGGSNLIETYFEAAGPVNQIADKTLRLAAGTYYYKLVRNEADGDPDEGYASLQIRKMVYETLLPYEVGGCRVISIEINDGFGHTTKKTYNYRDRIDSIMFRSIPDYISRSGISVNHIVGEGVALCVSCGIQTKVHDESVVPMPGNPVEYKYVTEFTDENAGNGKIDYEFTVAENLTEQRHTPFVSPFLSTWRGGLASLKKVYKRNGSGFDLLQKDTMVYENTYPYDSIIKGVKVEYGVWCEQEGIDYRVLSYTQENYQTEKFYQKSIAQTIYDNTGILGTGSESFFSSPKHTLATETRTVNSKDETIKEKIKYSIDYDTTGISLDFDAFGIRTAQRKNILVPVEKLTVKAIGGTDYIIGGTLIVYTTDKALPWKIYQLKLANPVLLSSFSHSTIASGAFSKSSLYEEKAEFTLYDAENNVLEERYTNNVTKSYLWDYKKLHLIAEVQNATNLEIGYTSFESDGKGNWSFNSTARDVTTAFTGKQSYNLSNGNIIKQGYNNGRRVVVSYWAKTGSKAVSGNSHSVATGRTINGWTYYQHEVAVTFNTVTVSGSGVIDELRIYPKGAQMSTYTYAPLVGITTMGDPNSATIYYEYDDNNRLKFIKDCDGNIIKSFQYHTTNTISY